MLRGRQSITELAILLRGQTALPPLVGWPLDAARRVDRNYALRHGKG
jgi:hypothetical protein